MDCFLEALFKWDCGFVGKEFLGKGDVGEGMFYIAGTGVSVERLNILAEQLINHINSLVDGYGLAAGDIQDLAGSVLGPCGK